jgi:hypothetical protein
MTSIHCSDLDALLFDGSPEAMKTAAQHASGCPGCAETLAAWSELSTTARAMHRTWDNETLWPRIERALKAERKRSPSRRLWQYAAAIVITIGLGATMFSALRSQTRDAAFDETILRLSAIDDVERAERAHESAIDALEDVAEARLEDPQTPLMIAYKEKLMLLDDAIEECQSNIDRNRQNAHLRRQLLAMYSDKQQTLREVLREEPNVSTP